MGSKKKKNTGNKSNANQHNLTAKTQNPVSATKSTDKVNTMSKKQQRYMKYKRNKKRNRIITAAVASIIILAVVLVVFLQKEQRIPFDAGLFDTKIEALENEIFNEERGDIKNMVNADTDKSGYVFFISVSDKESQAYVLHDSGDTPKAAWENAIKKARDFIIKSQYNAFWVKADIVNNTRKMKTDELPDLLKPLFKKYLREGIAFDEKFNFAFMESEVNASVLLSYDERKVNENNIRKYLERTNEPKKFSKVGDELIMFTTLGFFCDEDKTVYECYTNETDLGRRVIGFPDDEYITDIVVKNKEFLVDNAKEDGSFVYGYNPVNGGTLISYNILRHAGAVMELINQYDMFKDKKLIPVIENGIDFLLESVAYSEQGVAYIVEERSQEIKLGGNALAILCLSAYTEKLENDEYVELCKELGEGILRLMNNDGSYHHILQYPSFERGEEYRTVYYDGEATYALSRLYSITGDEKYLEAAKTAVEYFIAEDYTVHADHWVAYAVKEVTKYVTDERYFEFGLRNAQNNLEKIYNRATSYHTYMELLMATFELYDRDKEKYADLEYLKDGFDEKFFLETIFKRCWHVLNTFGYPEFVMYLQRPNKILNSFFVKHDDYRVRIDDSQHALGGYHMYIKHYDKLIGYAEEVNADLSFIH